MEIRDEKNSFQSFHLFDYSSLFYSCFWFKGKERNCVLLGPVHSGEKEF